ncbi:MAG: hypothetical protein HY727_21770 [Candidatus Rokubacteria bacterium]|nr:hypothetical protein [Candidatus Rokubacteria bacterium]
MIRLVGSRARPSSPTTRAGSVLLSLALVALLAAPARSADPVLYSVASSDDLLRVIDPTTGATLSSVPMTLSGATVEKALGLATHPATNQLWAILKLLGNPLRELAIVDPATGVATSIGNTGDSFAGIAFDCDGRLFGVTGDGASTPETLFTLSTTDATPTLFASLGRGDDGETIAFNPDDGRLYHASGHVGDYDPVFDDGVIFESLDLSVTPVVDIPIGSPLTDGEVRALTFWESEGVFLWKQGSSGDPLFRVTPAGVATTVGNTDHKLKGLAFAGGTLYSVSPNDSLLRAIDPTTAQTLSSVPITLAGDTVLKGNGLATHPTTGVLWALLETSSTSSRTLVTIDRVTGVATLVGETGDFFAALAFDSSETLYAVTGGESSVGEGTLFTLSTVDATPTLVGFLGRGDDGEALAFNPLDGRLYHASGLSDVIFESVDPAGFPTDIPIAGTALVDEEAQALTYWQSQGVFLWKQDHSFPAPLFRVTPAGVPTLIGDLDHQAKGLAFVPTFSCGPLTPTNLTAALGAGASVSLAWTDASNNETGFEIERDSGGGFTPLTTVGAGVATFQDTGLVADNTYSYRVRAVNASGASAFSNTATITVLVGKLLVLPARVTFFRPTIPSTPTETVTLQNVGRATLTGSVGTLPAPFSVTGGAGVFSLAPGATLTVTIQFSASTRGTARSALSVTSTDPARPSARVPVSAIVR